MRSSTHFTALPRKARRRAHRHLLAAHVRLLPERPADVAAPHRDRRPATRGATPARHEAGAGSGARRRPQASLPPGRTGRAPARPSSGRFASVLLEPGAHHDVGTCEGGIDVAVAGVTLGHDVGAELVEQRRRRRVERVVDRDHRGQLVDDHVYQLARVLREARVSATTNATGSPTTRTLSPRAPRTGAWRGAADRAAPGRRPRPRGRRR